MHNLITWCQESKNKRVAKVSHKSDKQKMAEQIMSGAIAKAVAEATRIVIQMMAEMQAQRTPNVAGPKLGAATLKQPTLNWETLDKYTELKAFILEVRNVWSMYNTQKNRQNR